MRSTNPLAIPSLVLSLLVLASAGFLAVYQWLERRRRDPDATDEDWAHYARQDVRRRRGTVLMALIGASISVSYWVDPAAGRNEARQVFATWVLIAALMLVMLGLAILDWAATVAFARRHRQQLLRERQALVEAHRRQFARLREASSGPPGTDGPPSAPS